MSEILVSPTESNEFIRQAQDAVESTFVELPESGPRIVIDGGGLDVNRLDIAKTGASLKTGITTELEAVRTEAPDANRDTGAATLDAVLSMPANQVEKIEHSDISGALVPVATPELSKVEPEPATPVLEPELTQDSVHTEVTADAPAVLEAQKVNT
ncbi:MAG: hypothetical protein NTV39_04265 [Candidatus Saccharibacteria bacterium]|nr:hypothetical protein [Candidatus Saccharibacteria bacterium]